MISLATNSSRPVEDALHDFERHQDSQPDESAADVERVEKGIAEYFVDHIFPKGCRDSSALESRCTVRFLQIAQDEIDEVQLSDILQSSSASQEFANECALKLAREYREELEPLAAEYGCIEGHPGSRRKPTEDEVETLFFS